MSKYKGLGSRIWAGRFVYLILLPVMAYYIIFFYLPIFNIQTGGILMAFKHFRINRTFFEMEWVGFQWFEMLFNLPAFWQVMRNTMYISFGRLLFEFPIPIILAILLNEVRHSKSKRIYQTIFTFPHFMSWVLIMSLMRDLLLADGIINQILALFTGQTIQFLSAPTIPINLFLVFITSIWKSTGWVAIIYLATISGIDPTLYEAAMVDGANRWHRIKHITWPGIKSVVVLLLILNCGNILNAGFDQIFNMRNAVNKNALEILDTYIYSLAFGGNFNQSFAAAAGLFKTIINFALLLTANKIAHLLGEEGLFGRGVKG